MLRIRLNEVSGKSFRGGRSFEWLETGSAALLRSIWKIFRDEKFGSRDIAGSRQTTLFSTTSLFLLPVLSLSLVIFHARLDGAFIVSSKRAPHPSSCEMFSRLARCLARLSTNSSYQSELGGIRGWPEVIWTIARKHLGRTESSPIPPHPPLWNERIPPPKQRLPSANVTKLR